MAKVVPAQPTQEMACHFSELLVLSAPSFFEVLWGSLKLEMARRCFLKKGNLFSYQHVLFLEDKGMVKGMALGYSFEKERKERLFTGFLMATYLFLFRERTKIPFLLRISPLGKVNQGEFYLSNLAVYPEYRSQGFGRMLLGTFEEKARAFGANYLVLDVEKNNDRAISFYRRLGYYFEKELNPIELNRTFFNFLRMKKCLK